MIAKSSICFMSSFSFLSPLANANSYQILQQDRSPRMQTFWEAAIAVPNSSETPHLETPTSGLVNEINVGGSYGAFSGETKLEFEPPNDSGGPNPNLFEGKWKGDSLNLFFFTPFTSMIKTGLLITGGIQENELEFKKNTDSQAKARQFSLSAHGIMQVQNSTFTLSIYNRNEKKESSLTSNLSSSRKGSVSYNSYGLGLRHDFLPTFSLAATYKPKATKTFVYKSRLTELNTETNTSETTISEDNDFEYQNQALSIAASLRLPDQNLTLAAGVSRLFPDKITIDSKERDLVGMTNLSLAAEMRLQSNSLDLTPRVGIHNIEESKSSLRSIQAGLTFDFGSMAADASLGYNQMQTDRNESDGSELSIHYFNLALGLGMKI